MDYSHTLNNFDKYDEPRLHIERLLKVHLLEFGLSLRILCPLEDAGIITLGDFVNKSAKDLLKIKMLGSVSVEKIEKFLEYHGFSLAK